MSDNPVKGPKYILPDPSMNAFSGPSEVARTIEGYACGDDTVDLQDRYGSRYPSAVAGQKRSRDDIGYGTGIPAISQDDPFGPKKRKKISYVCDICHDSAVQKVGYSKTGGAKSVKVKTDAD